MDDQLGTAFSIDSNSTSAEVYADAIDAQESASPSHLPKRAMGSPWPWSVPDRPGHYKTRAEAILAAVESGQDAIIYQPLGATLPHREQLWLGDVMAARHRMAGQAGAQTMMLLVTPVVARVYACKRPLSVPAKAAIPGWHVFNVTDARNLLADAEGRCADPEQGVADAFCRMKMRIRGTMTRLGFKIRQVDAA